MKQYKYKVNGAQYDVTIDSICGNIAKVEVNGIPFEVEMQGSTLTEGDLPTVDISSVNDAPAAAPASSAPVTTPTGAGEGTPIKAPLPGVVTKILVQVGQNVKKGDTVVVLEAMKMENNITAECDGTISGIAVAQGANVLEGSVLLTIG